MYNVLENMQILKRTEFIQGITEVWIPYGTAKEFSKTGFYENVDDILYIEPQKETETGV